MYARLAPFVVVCLLAVGCDKSTPEPPQTTLPTTIAEPVRTTGAEKAAVWSPAPDAIDDTQNGQLAQAKAAQKELGATLAKALTDSVAKDGFAASIEFCRGEAPGVATKVGASHDVKIGRTSQKLRNPANAAPAWAADAVAGADSDMKLFVGPSGELGVLSPIELGALCVNCHGSADALAEGVADALREKYPEDQATGFAAGDLRGWFWVEVPAS